MAGSASGMGRILGLGFLVGATDHGATSVATGVANAFTRTRDAVIGLARESTSLQRFGNAISSLNFMQLTRVGDALDGIAERAGALQRAGDTSLESFGVQAGQAFRQATAGLGQYREQVEQYRGQITSAAFNLGVDTGQLTSAVAQLVRTGQSLDDYGLTVREIAGSEQAGILTAQQLTQTLSALSEGYELGAEGATALLDRVTALGEGFGFGADAARAIPNILQAADPILAEFGDLSVDDVTESITRLSAAMAEGLGVDFEQASGDAIAIFQQLGQSRTELADLMTGLGGGEFNDLARELGIFTGDVDGSIEAIMQNPFEFAQRMREMYQSISDPQARDRLMGSLRSLPANFRFLITGGEEMQGAMEHAAQGVDDATGAFGRMSRGASGAARTFGESMELIEEGFRTRLNAMARRHYPGFERDVLQRQRRGFANLTETINDFADQRGPLGALTRTMLATRRGGVTGLSIALERELGDRFPVLAQRIGQTLPMLGELGEGMFEVASQSGPMLLALSQMGVRIPRLGGAFRMLLNPFTIFVAGGALLVRNWDRVGPMLRDISLKLRDMSRQFLQWSRSIDWTEMGRNVVDGLLGMFDDAAGVVASDDASQVGSALGEFFRNAFQAAGSIVRGLASGLWERVSEWISEPATIQGSLGRGTAAAGAAVGAAMFTPMRGPLLAAGRGVFGQVFRGLGAMFQGGGLMGAGRLVLRRIPVIGAFLGVLFDLPEIIDAYETGGIGQALLRTAASAIDGLLLGIPSLLSNAVQGTNLGDAFSILGDVIGGDLLGGWQNAMSGLNDAWEEWGSPMVDSIMNFGEDVITMFTEIFEDVAAPFVQDLAGMFVDDIEGTGGGAFTELGNIAGAVFRRVGQAASFMWNSFIKPVFILMLRAASAYVGFMTRNVLPVFTRLGHIATDVIMNIVGLFRTVTTFAGGFSDIAGAAFQLLGAKIRNFFVIPFMEARGATQTLGENFAIMAAMIELKFAQMARTILRTINRVASAIPGLDGFDTTGVDSAVTQREGALRTLRARQQTRQERLSADIAQRRAEATALQLRLEREMESTQQRVEAQRRRTEQQRQAAHARVDRMSQMFMDAGSNLEEVITRLSSGDIGRERIERVREASQETLAQIRQQAESGALGQEAATRFVSQLQEAAASGNARQVRAVQEEMRQAVESAEREAESTRRRPGRRRTTRRRRGGVVGTPASEGAEASPAAQAREAQEQAAQAQREQQAEEQRIGAFSDQAVSQLAGAFASALRQAGFSGRTGGSRGAPRGARPSGPSSVQ